LRSRKVAKRGISIFRRFCVAKLTNAERGSGWKESLALSG
jgi:hypothetical protein